MAGRGRGAALGVLLAIGLAMGPAGAAPAAARGDPAAGSATHLAAVTQPVVQLVQIELEATISAPNAVPDTAADEALKQQLWGQQRDRRLSLDLQSINRQWIQAHLRDVDRYLVAKGTVSRTAKLTATCSGWFATPDGYLVTAAHCVQPDRAALLRELMPRALAEDLANDKAESLRNFQRDGIPLDNQMRADLLAITDTWYAKHATLTALKVTVSVQVAVPGEDGRRGLAASSATVVSAGEPFPGRDVALLKVDGFTDLPSLALGDDAQLRVGDTLYLDGFPGTVLDAAQLSEASRREPSFTLGPVSAFRSTVNGVPYVQTQAPAYHGNSGGPVLNDRGAVIGILVAGVADPQTGQAVEGQEFVLRRDGVAQELARHGVTAVTSRTTQEYATALADFDRSYFSRAKAEFEQLLVLHPRHPYAAHYVTLCAQEIQAGHDRTPGFPWLFAALAAACVVIVGLLAAVVLLLRGRRAAPTAASASTAPPVLPAPLVVPEQPVDQAAGPEPQAR